MVGEGKRQALEGLASVFSGKATAQETAKTTTPPGRFTPSRPNRDLARACPRGAGAPAARPAPGGPAGGYQAEVPASPAHELPGCEGYPPPALDQHEQGSVTWTGPTVCHKREERTPQEKEKGKNSAVDYFRRQQQLVDLGLLEWVPCLIESDDPDAEIIHSYGMGGSTSLEDRLGASARHVAHTMLTDGQCRWADEQGLWLAPVLRHITNVQLTGIARLRYRPQTRKTEAWWADQQAKGEGYLDRYMSWAKL